MTLARILALAQKEHLRTEMEVFLSYLLKMSRLDLIAESEREIPVEQLAVLQSAWMKLKAGYPVAYLVKNKEFFGLNFEVDERVLIPRPCTEQLVEWTAQVAQFKVLEIGTGSGAIAVALKSCRPDLGIWASDLSRDALALANKNSVQNGFDVHFFYSDLLEDVPHFDFDTLVTNLPYIGTETHALVDENVQKYEPAHALFGGEDGLALYARLFDQIREGGWPFRFVLGEIGFSQGKAIMDLAQRCLPNWSFELRQDLEGLDRHFLLEKKSEI